MTPTAWNLAGRRKEFGTVHMSDIDARRYLNCTIKSAGGGGTSTPRALEQLSVCEQRRQCELPPRGRAACLITKISSKARSEGHIRIPSPGGRTSYPPAKGRPIS